ncbi:MAG TPA: hypothetical protein VNQ73_09335 [Ilumatobacter sp.]|nr:hypothetical protein [Ilumatobacter sp.]
MNRRAKTAAALAAVVLAAGATLVRCSVTGPSSAPDPAPATTVVDAAPVAVGGAGPAGEAAGMPVGFSGTRDGAVAAAVAYAGASQRWLYFDDDEIAAAVGVLATSAAAGRLTAEVVSEVGLARDALGQSSGRVWWLVHPLATRVEFFTGDAARVSVWTVTVLAASGVALPQSEWMIVTIDLAWDDGDWRIDDVRSALGPTPILSPKDEPWPSERFDTGLDGFARIDGATS